MKLTVDTAGGSALCVVWRGRHVLIATECVAEAEKMLREAKRSHEQDPGSSAPRLDIYARISSSLSRVGDDSAVDTDPSPVRSV